MNTSANHCGRSSAAQLENRSARQHQHHRADRHQIDEVTKPRPVAGADRVFEMHVFLHPERVDIHQGIQPARHVRKDRHADQRTEHRRREQPPAHRAETQETVGGEQGEDRYEHEKRVFLRGYHQRKPRRVGRQPAPMPRLAQTFPQGPERQQHEEFEKPVDQRMLRQMNLQRWKTPSAQIRPAPSAGRAANRRANNPATNNDITPNKRETA